MPERPSSCARGTEAFGQSCMRPKAWRRIGVAVLADCFPFASFWDYLSTCFPIRFCSAVSFAHPGLHFRDNCLNGCNQVLQVEPGLWRWFALNAASALHADLQSIFSSRAGRRLCWRFTSAVRPAEHTPSSTFGRCDSGIWPILLEILLCTSRYKASAPV